MELLMRLLFTLVVTLLICSCDDKNETKTVPASQARQRYIRKPTSANHDTLTIRERAVVFFNPDSIQLEKVRELLDTSVYKSIMHDYFYQLSFARKFIRKSWPALAIIDAKNYRYMLFVKRDESRKCIDLDEKGDLYGIFLFDGKKGPVLADMPNIKTVLNFYFKDQ